MNAEQLLAVLLVTWVGGTFLFVIVIPVIGCLLGYTTGACDGGGY